MIQLNNDGNFTTVELNNSTLYFSYKTLIGVRTGGKLFVSQNQWSKTTAKHLNSIDGGSKEALSNRLGVDEWKRVCDSFALVLEAKFRAGSF
jgi:hypothetical protein